MNFPTEAEYDEMLRDIEVEEAEVSTDETVLHSPQYKSIIFSKSMQFKKQYMEIILKNKKRSRLISCQQKHKFCRWL